MTTISAVVSAILAALAVNLGTFDLSATDQVQEGTFREPPGSVAFAGVCPAVQTGAVQQGPAYYLEDYTVKVRLWAPVTAGTTANRAARGRTMANEAKAKLDAAHNSAGNGLLIGVPKYACTATDPDPSAFASLPGWGTAELTLTLTLRRAVST